MGVLPPVSGAMRRGRSSAAGAAVAGPAAKPRRGTSIKRPSQDAAGFDGVVVDERRAKLFATLDRDSSGNLDPAEFEAAFRIISQVAPETVNLSLDFSALDQNQDGTLDVGEFGKLLDSARELLGTRRFRKMEQALLDRRHAAEPAQRHPPIKDRTAAAPLPPLERSSSASSSSRPLPLPSAEKKPARSASCQGDPNDALLDVVCAKVIDLAEVRDLVRKAGADPGKRKTIVGLIWNTDAPRSAVQDTLKTLIRLLPKEKTETLEIAGFELIDRIAFEPEEKIRDWFFDDLKSVFGISRNHASTVACQALLDKLEFKSMHPLSLTMFELYDAIFKVDFGTRRAMDTVGILDLGAERQLGIPDIIMANRCTPLEEMMSIMDFLKNKGVDLDLAEASSGITPLIIAARCHCYDNIRASITVSLGPERAMEAFARFRADEFDYMATRTLMGLDGLVGKGNDDGVAEALRARADPNYREAIGWAPLHRACFLGKGRVVELLLEARADPDALENEGGRPLHYSTYDTEGHLRAVQALVAARASTVAVDKVGRSALMYTAQSPLVQAALLKAEGSEPLRPPLTWPELQGALRDGPDLDSRVDTLLNLGFGEDGGNLKLMREDAHGRLQANPSDRLQLRNMSWSIRDPHSGSNRELVELVEQELLEPLIRWISGDAANRRRRHTEPFVNSWGPVQDTKNPHGLRFRVILTPVPYDAWDPQLLLRVGGGGGGDDEGEEVPMEFLLGSSAPQNLDPRVATLKPAWYAKTAAFGDLWLAAQGGLGVMRVGYLPPGQEAAKSVKAVWMQAVKEDEVGLRDEDFAPPKALFKRNVTFARYVLFNGIGKGGSSLEVAQEGLRVIGEQLEKYYQTLPKVVKELTSSPEEKMNNGALWPALHQFYAITGAADVEGRGEEGLDWIFEKNVSRAFEQLVLRGSFETLGQLCSWIGNMDLERGMDAEFWGSLFVQFLLGQARRVDTPLQKRLQSRYGEKHHAGPLKGIARILAKQSDYEEISRRMFGTERGVIVMAGGIVDLCRFTLIFDSPAELVECYYTFRAMTLEADGIEITRVKNGFHADAKAPAGYRDIKLNLLCRFDNVTHIVEGQLHLLTYATAKEKSHVLYEVLRGDF